MTDYYLKFPEKPELADELVSNEEVTVDVVGQITTPFVFPVIGRKTVTLTPSWYNSDTNDIEYGDPYEEEQNVYGEEPISGGEKLEGWHVNLRMDGELPDNLQEYQVFPEAPIRVWL